MNETTSYYDFVDYTVVETQMMMTCLGQLRNCCCIVLIIKLTKYMLTVTVYLNFGHKVISV